MARIISVTNQKGGVGKTTTVIELGALYARRFPEHKVLILDLDSQRNATSVLLKRHDHNPEESTLALLKGNKLHSAQLKNTDVDNLFVVPASLQLIEAESLLSGALDGFFRLSESLSEAKKEFALVLLDCPPSLSLVTINALVAADYLIVPLQISKFSLDGITAIADAVATVQKRYNPYLKIAGAVLTMYDPRTTLAQAMAPEIEKFIPLFKTGIPRSVAIEEAHLLKKDIHEYAPKSRAAQAYAQLLDEVLHVIN